MLDGHEADSNQNVNINCSNQFINNFFGSDGVKFMSAEGELEEEKRSIDRWPGNDDTANDDTQNNIVNF